MKDSGRWRSSPSASENVSQSVRKCLLSSSSKNATCPSKEAAVAFACRRTAAATALLFAAVNTSASVNFADAKRFLMRVTLLYRYGRRSPSSRGFLGLCSDQGLDHGERCPRREARPPNLSGSSRIPSRRWLGVRQTAPSLKEVFASAPGRISVSFSISTAIAKRRQVVCCCRSVVC